MSIHEQKDNSKINNINTNLIYDKVSSLIDIIINEERYEEGKNEIIELFKDNISNEKVIQLCLTIIHNIIMSKGNSKHKILSIIPDICQINPNKIYSLIDLILSIFQSCFSEDNSPYYSQVSQYFGDTAKILLNDLNTQNHNSNIYTNNSKRFQNNQKDLIFTYSKFKNFCLSNINSNNTGWQICGTLCLTSFIENCSFNFINEENIKCTFDNLCTQIQNPNFPGKLEILNCFISLVFCSEEKFIPYSLKTLNIIIQFIQDEEWLIRKFSLNIIYTMLYYCKKEIMDKKEFILEKLKLLEKETNYEVKETVEQIYRMINEEESTDNNRIKYFSETKINSNNSQFSSGEISKKYFNCSMSSMSNKEFKICEDKKDEEKAKKSKKMTNTGHCISKKTFQNSFAKNKKYKQKNNNEKPQIQTKTNKKRKNFNKSSDIIIDNYINNTSSKNFFPKLLNHSNNNKTNRNIELGIYSNKHKRRNDFPKKFVNKARSNKNIPPSRNSVDKFYGMQKKNQISMTLKKNNMIYNSINNNLSTDMQYSKRKAKENYNYESPGKSKKKIINLKNSNLSNKNKSKKMNPVYSSNKSQKMNNIYPNNIYNIQTHINKGRNDFNIQNNFISNTIYLNNSMQERNVLTLNKIQSFGPKLEEGNNLNTHNYIYCDDNSNNIEETKINKNKNKKNCKNKHNYSFDGKLNNSKRYFMNTSVENDILNFTSSESRENVDYDNRKNRPNLINNNNLKKIKSKNKYNPMIKKYENNSNNNYINGKTCSKQHNNLQKNKRVSKLNKKNISTELNNNNNYIYIYNPNNYQKDSKLKLIKSKNKFSPGNELKNSKDFNKLFHSFSNRENDKKGNKNNNKFNNKETKNSTKKIGHKGIYSLQINNGNNTNSKINNFKNNNYSKNTNNTKRRTKNSSNKHIQEIQENKNINMNNINNMNNLNNMNNNIIFHNGDLSIIDNKAIIEETNNDLNFELLSKKDDSIELKFKEYKNETTKIIDDLKSQVYFLKKTLGNFEENAKKKEKLNNEVKNKNFNQAFETAVDLGNIQDIYYVIKKYQLLTVREDIPSNLLGNIMKILCEDILSCENLRLVINFILSNICDKNIIFDKILNNEISNVFNDLYNQRIELCLMKKDISNIVKIANYFQ